MRGRVEQARLVGYVDERIEAPRLLGIGRIEVDQVIAAARWDATNDSLDEIAVRIEDQAGQKAPPSGSDLRKE